MRVAVGAPAATAVALLLVAVGPGLAAAPTPLDQARDAAETVPFQGVLDVQWNDGATTHTEKLTVQAGDGTLLVLGGNEVMAVSPFERLVAHGGDSWEEVWLPSASPGPRPDGLSKYQMTDAGAGPVVAGRPTRTVEVSEHGLVRERLYLDTATNLLLRREQYDDKGTMVRTVSFETVTIAAPGPQPAQPVSMVNHAPKPVDVQRVDDGSAPGGLADGYQRVGVYQDAGVLHVLYSDGVYDLSVFEQGGRLRPADLPSSGDRVRVASSTGWHYTWPGGDVVVWAAKGRVFTAVSDAPEDQVLRAADSFPDLPARHLSLVAKLRRACQSLMQPLS